jgi:hypothetical protein
MFITKYIERNATMETFKTFPATKADALTLLYLQNQDLSDKTIEEIVALYDNISKRAIKACNVNVKLR